MKVERLLSVLPVGQKAGTCIVQHTLRQSIHKTWTYKLRPCFVYRCHKTYNKCGKLLHTYIIMYTHVSERVHIQVNQIPECTYILHTHSK